MPIPTLLRTPGVLAFALTLLSLAVLPSRPAAAQSDSDSAKPPAAAAANAKSGPPADKSTDKDKLPPLPPDAHVQQSIVLDGKKLNYTVTVGTLPVRDSEGKTAGELVYTAYTVEGADRPVTFAVNGGPGASSVFLNFGAIGPKHLKMGNEGDSPSDPATLTDNQGTWLDFTDLVFLDPIGTGFSRSLVSADETKKLFWTTEPDIEYLSRAIYDWLVKNDRLQSRKYLTGESYGGFRGPRITYFLQSQLGVAMNGVVLVSPYLNPTIEQNGDLSPLPWMVTLPSITAANLERQGKLTPEAMQSVIAYTLGDYATTLIKGRSDPADTDAMIKKVTDMTGLDAQFVKYSGGRLETQAFLREVHREQGKLGSVYDSNVTMFDPFPYAPEQRANDPLLATLIAPTTTAMVDFDTRVVGWKVDARYNTLSYEVATSWNRDQDLRSGKTICLPRSLLDSLGEGGYSPRQSGRNRKRVVMTQDAPIDLLQGTLDMLVLKAVSLGPLHGYGVLLRIQQISRGRLEIQQGSLYPALYRLEHEGWIAGEWGQSENKRRARFYRLTAAGRKRLDAETKKWQEFAGVVGAILDAVPVSSNR